MISFNNNIKRFTSSLFLILIMIFSPLISWANDSLVKQTKEFYVNDEANVLNSSVEEYILDVNKRFERTKEKPQVVVTTVSSLGDKTVEEYANKLFEKYKIGHKKYDNGVLVLLAPNERKIRIEVGYGLEGAITDTKSGVILDSSMSFLSKDDFSSAIKMIFDNICNEISLEYEYDSSVFEVTDDMYLVDYSDVDTLSPLSKALTVVLIILLVILICWDFKYNDGAITEILLCLIQILGSSRGDSSSRGSSGGGGRSGGGGSSRSF